jgi:hypothetical protein
LTIHEIITAQIETTTKFANPKGLERGTNKQIKVYGKKILLMYLSEMTRPGEENYVQRRSVR